MQRLFFLFMTFAISHQILAQRASQDYSTEYNRAIENGRIQLAIEVSALWEAEFPSSVEPFYRSAKALAKKGRRNDAIFSLKQALELDSTHVPSLLSLAELTKESNISSALKLYDKLIIHP